MSRAVAVLLVLAVAALPARADRAAPAASPAERALRSHAVFVGKVVSLEKDKIDATPFPGSRNKQPYAVEVVKIETALAGTDGLTHIKIGVTADRGYEVKLAEGREALFFATKHHEGAFHVIPYMTPPLDTNGPNFKQQVEEARKALAAVADPAKALKAEKAEDRAAAAAMIVFKLRTPNDPAPNGFEPAPLTADESRPILKALAEVAWKEDRREQTLGGFRSFAMLGLTAADGWKPPAPEAGKDYVEMTRAAFVAWLDGPGKDYRIKKLVPKK